MFLPVNHSIDKLYISLTGLTVDVPSRYNGLYLISTTGSDLWGAAVPAHRRMPDLWKRVQIRPVLVVTASAFALTQYPHTTISNDPQIILYLQYDATVHVPYTQPHADIRRRPWLRIQYRDTCIVDTTYDAGHYILHLVTIDPRPNSLQCCKIEDCLMTVGCFSE